jgi:hypothetical protein
VQLFGFRSSKPFPKGDCGRKRIYFLAVFENTLKIFIYEVTIYTTSLFRNLPKWFKLDFVTYFDYFASIPVPREGF